ncbi:unnamed protein product [Rotaria magnacalcarata]|uniref:ANK_REP_REGION domain-containing protein n=1 Tax=Rotaria magnacalcarata TaxID=392030 RepID=A0A816TE84_9BILA|nr:unnamed protein product [Rotaria magnacalcarata]
MYLNEYSRVCEDNSNNNDDHNGESSTAIDSFRPSKPIFNRVSKKSKSFQCHQTNDAVYAQHYRTPLKQLQAMFWPTCDTPLANEQTISSSDTKLLAMKTIPSVRISPPQQLHDSCFDWDDEDRRFAPTIELPGGQSTLNLNHHTMTVSAKREGSLDTRELQGQILLYLAAKLGHEEIMRKLITETSHTRSLLNTRGQTPLLCAIETGSTLTATLLMEQDPMSSTCKDDIGSSVFHYATEHCNDIVLSRAIALLKRLSPSAAQLTAEMIPWVPLLLEQFVGEDGVDLSVVDDCLRARLVAHRCMFGRSKRFSTSN